ncbi:hypothetical protein KA005_13510, partial [bacterium]|nr:hypothetical protein [bacterium]
MVRFFIRRYLFALLLRRIWLPFALIPPLVYLGVSASLPDRFSIYQDISISQDATFPVPTSPVGIMPISKIISNPADFFLDKHAIKGISEMLSAGTTTGQDSTLLRTFIDKIEAEMSLDMVTAKKIRIAYYGTDQSSGKKLVAYYSKRLLKKADEGARRSRLHGPKRRLAQREVASSTADFLGRTETREERALWRADRSLPAMQILILSLIALLSLIGVIEFIDPSFKSERQVARYLELRGLGALPDLNKLSRAIGINR